jgi:putative DNA primase/helicase
MDAVDQFKQAIEAAGLTAPDTIIPGHWHKFPGFQKNGKNKAAYCFMFDDMRGGVFGDFSSGMATTWHAANSKPYTAEERGVHRARIAAIQAQRDAGQVQRQQNASRSAAVILANTSPARSHEYLTARGIQPHGVRCDGVRLLIPMRDTSGAVQSLQTITPDGDKRFHSGGKVTGCYFGIGKPDGLVIVCEGFATGASIRECTGHAVAVAFNAGNLQPVAVALHSKYPAVKIIIAADDDHLTPGNPGMTKALAAAQAVGGFLAVPSFPADRPDKATDFNDLHQLAGAGAVQGCIEAATVCGTAGADDWPEPTPLPNALPPVDAFDAELLPVALRTWVMDIAHRMQCPADFPAVAALVALSSLIGARAVIQPKARDDWQVVPNLWGAIVGRPGVKKSPALGEALKPLHRLQAAEFELNKAAHEAWALDCKVAEIQAYWNEKKAKGLASKDPAAARALLEPVDAPAEPKARSYIENDATVEALGVVMNENPWGLLAYRDELYGLLTSLDKQGQEGSRAFYLQSYDGNQGYKFTRIIRGITYIPRVCLAMIGGIQPGRIQEYVRGAVAGGSADDGLLQRFGLTVWPDVTGEYVHVDQWPDIPAKQTAWAVFERLAALEPASDTDPVIWRFTLAAQEIFVEWLVPFETEIRGDAFHPAMVSHLAKYRKLIPALALVFALIDTPESGGVIHEDELIRALAWGDYLRSHANRLYAAAVMPETTDAASLLAKIKAGKLTDTDGVMLERFTPRQIAVKGWAGLGTPEAVRKAADLLADYDWLRKDMTPPGATGGRPSERYTINPAAMKGGTQ